MTQAHRELRTRATRTDSSHANDPFRYTVHRIGSISEVLLREPFQTARQLTHHAQLGVADAEYDNVGLTRRMPNF